MDPSPAWGIAVVWGGHPLPRTPLLCHSQSCGSHRVLGGSRQPSSPHGLYFGVDLSLPALTHPWGHVSISPPPPTEPRFSGDPSNGDTGTQPAGSHPARC